MADFAISRPAASARLGGVAADGRNGQHREPPPDSERRRRSPASPELAVALAGDAAVTAVFETGPDGEPLIRIVDGERGETVAVLTPEELQALTASTGLPPGLLLRRAS